MFGIGKQTALALDIGSSSIKLLQLAKRDDEFVATAAAYHGIVDLPEDEPDRHVALVGAIQQCVQNTGVKTKHVVCAVKGPELTIRGFCFPFLQDDEIEDAVGLEAEQAAPLGLKGCTIDYARSPISAAVLESPVVAALNTQEKIHGLIVICPDELIQKRRKLLTDAGLKCALIDVDSVALLNGFSQYITPQPYQAILLVHVGNTVTDFIIYPFTGAPFMRELSCAGRRIINHISSDCAMSPDTVRQILFNDTKAGKNIERENMVKACQNLTVNIRETIRYYYTQENSLPLEGIYACGDFVLAKNFVDILSEELSEQILIWNPFDKINFVENINKQDVVKQHGPAFAVAAGLAMRLI